MIKIKFHGSYHPSVDINKTIYQINLENEQCINWFKIIYNKNESYIWNNFFELTNDDDYDYIVIINYPHPNFKYDENKVILISTEPYMILNYWVNDLKKEFKDYSFSLDNKNYFINYLPINGGFNFSSVNYNHSAVNSNFIEHKHNDVLSILISNKYMFEGHKHRIDFIRNNLNNSNILFDRIYDEQYTNFFDQKNEFSLKWFEEKNKKFTSSPFTAYSDYKYNFNAENCYEDNYHTEKLIHCIYGDCLCFYSGSETIFNFVDPVYYIFLNIKDEINRQESIEIIEKSIKDKEWEKRIDKMVRLKKETCKQFNVLYMIERIIKEKL